MAKDKTTVLVYAEWNDTFKALSDEQAGKLAKHLFAFVSDEDPDGDDLTELLFIPMRQSLERNLEKWKETKQKRSKAGKASAAARAEKKEQNQHMLTHVESDEQKPTNSTDSVSVSVSVSDSVSDSDILLKKETKDINRFNFKNELIEFGFREDLISDWLKVRSKKKASNTSTALKGFIREVEDALYKGWDANEILEMCIVNDWKGFKADWIEPKHTNTNTNDDEIQRELRKELEDEGYISKG